MGPVLPDGDGYGFPRGERAYRQPQYRESRTFGDYELGAPPGLDPVRSATTQQHANQNVSAQPVPGQAEEKKEPSPLDILITGMTQLQQVLLKKNETMDLETKGTPQLPKLGEYNPENGAIEFQDFLYLVEQQIGSLASGAGEWWQKTLEVSQAAYLEYQGLSPVKRLGVKAQLTAGRSAGSGANPQTVGCFGVRQWTTRGSAGNQALVPPPSAGFGSWGDAAG